MSTTYTRTFGALEAYAITYDGNCGTPTQNEDTVVKNNSAVLPSATLSGFVFSGWYTSPVGGTRVGGAGDAYKPTADITLYAQWTGVPITITFKGQDNHLISTLSIPKNTAPMVFTPNFEDAIFTGWFYDQSCTQPYNPTTPLSQDTTLWAEALEYLRFTSNPVSNGVITTLYNSNMFIFDATPSESAMDIVWDFGDGTTSTDRIAYHTYAEHGTYQVTLTSTNYYGQQDSVTYEVTYGSEVQDDSVGYGTLIAICILVAIVSFFVARRI